MTIRSARRLAAILAAVGLLLATGAVAASGSSRWPNAVHARERVPAADHHAAVPISYGVDIQAVFDVAGNPYLVANFTPDGRLATPSWSICRPSYLDICTPISDSQVLAPGPTPAGTVFQTSATYRGQTYIARTAPWQGTVHPTTPPHVDGSPRYHAPITPTGAQWTGGWGNEFDLLSIEACPTRSATRCVNLSAPARLGYGFSSQPVHPGAWFTGWYLFAFDQRLAKDTVFAEPGYLTPAVVPALKAGQAVARSAPLGPVTGPPPPTVQFLRRAITHDGRILVARIHCSVLCHVNLQVTDNRAVIGSHVTLTGSAMLGVRGKFRDGPLDVTLYVDDGPFVRGTTRLVP